MNHLSIIPFLLPTEDANPKTGMIGMNKYGHIIIIGDEFPVDKERFKPQYLYLCSNEKPKEGDWVVCSLTECLLYKVNKNNYEAIINLKCQKIILTTDPKLIVDGVLPIDGNTKAKSICLFCNGFGHGDLIACPECNGDGGELVNILTEFCKRWNEKNRVGIVRNGEPLYQPDTKKVDVEKLAEASARENYRTKFWELSEEIYKAGYNQALQSTGQFSLEDVRNKLSPIKNLLALLKHESPLFSTDERIQDLIEKEIAKSEKSIEYLQSLTPQPKRDIVIEVEMVKIWHYPANEPDSGEWIEIIKLTNGQPTLIFK